ncbi:hypothetical protein [Paenibacillus sp. 19GGS1-52]|nr:hypothetical protein [Paenibacillus sp. 19GGS1-52]
MDVVADVANTGDASLAKEALGCAKAPRACCPKQGAHCGLQQI